MTSNRKLSRTVRHLAVTLTVVAGICLSSLSSARMNPKPKLHETESVTARMNPKPKLHTADSVVARMNPKPRHHDAEVVAA